MSSKSDFIFKVLGTIFYGREMAREEADLKRQKAILANESASLEREKAYLEREKENLDTINKNQPLNSSYSDEPDDDWEKYKPDNYYYNPDSPYADDPLDYDEDGERGWWAD